MRNWLAHSVVALHQDSDRVAAVFGVEHAGRCPDPAFEFVADHASAAAYAAFFDRAVFAVSSAWKASSGFT